MGETKDLVDETKDESATSRILNNRGAKEEKQRGGPEGSSVE